MPDLIGALGLPGAVLALLAAAVLGVRLYRDLHGDRGLGDLPPEWAVAMESRLVARIGELEQETARQREAESKDVRNALTIMTGAIENRLQEQENRALRDRLGAGGST